MKLLVIIILVHFAGVLTTPIAAQDLDPRRVRLLLKDAVPLALSKAKEHFRGLERFKLASIRPDARMIANREDLSWVFQWEAIERSQEVLRVRVNMEDESLKVENATDGISHFGPLGYSIEMVEALPLALRFAEEKIPDLGNYLLCSVKRRSLKGDKNGVFWQFFWQEKAPPHHRRLVVRVYMRDKALKAKRSEKGTWQKKNDTYIHLNEEVLPTRDSEPVQLNKSQSRWSASSQWFVLLFIIVILIAYFFHRHVRRAR